MWEWDSLMTLAVFKVRLSDEKLAGPDVRVIAAAGKHD